MQITTETFGSVLVAHSPDDLTEEAVVGLVDAVTAALENGQRQFVLQMDRTESYDSAGLTALLDIQDAVRAEGGSMKISDLNDIGQKIFEVTRLDQRFDRFESVIDAVSSYS